METTKVCFKCNKEKPISDFYVHKMMGDGHLNKCKLCTKNDVSKRYETLIETPEFVEKERLRGRVKYAKYLYKNKIQHPENRSTAQYLRRKGYNLKLKEIHHWNYNFRNDVFLLNPRAHKLVHKFLKFDEESKCFIYNGTLITDKKHHFSCIKEIFFKSNVNYEIETV